MPNDAIIYYRQANALNDLLSGGRIDKIIMPSKDMIELFIHAKGNNYCLLMSAEPSHSRIQLTSVRLPTLPTAPAFLMHLRKHIGNGKILSVESVKYERIVIIRILKTDELFDATEKQLFIEVIGKYSNIILVNADGKISESIKHIPLDATSKRQILPGMNYVLPEAQNKLTLAEHEQFTQKLMQFEGANLYNYIMSNLAGFSPASIREAIYRVLGAKDYSGKLSDETAAKLTETLNMLYEQEGTPCVYFNNGIPCDFSATEFLSLGTDMKKYSALGDAMDVYFSAAANTKTETNTEKNKLANEIRHLISKNSKKIANFETKRAENQEYEEMRIKGELITANIYRIAPKATTVTLDNYYTGKPINIALDPQKTPQQNAQNYYKKYSKMKKTIEMCELQIEKGREEIEALEQLQLNLSLCSTPAELDEVFSEAEKIGINANPHKHNKKKIILSEPIRLLIMDYEVMIGKNSIQNERITRSAKPEDIWLHASKIPGSHVNKEYKRSHSARFRDRNGSASLRIFFQSGKCRQSTCRLHF